MKHIRPKIQVIDRETKQVLLECSLEESDRAYQFAAQMENLGIGIELIQPTLSETLASALGKSDDEFTQYAESMDQEIEAHEGSCCFEDQTHS